MLRKRGMIDPAEERLLAIKQSPIDEHLEAFDRSMVNNTPKHRKLTMTRVRKAVEGCRFKTLPEMDGEKVVDWLNATREKEDLGARTFNHYPQAVDAFGKWLAATKRLPLNPLSGVERLNSKPTFGTNDGRSRLRKSRDSWIRRDKVAKLFRATTASFGHAPLS